MTPETAVKPKSRLASSDAGDDKENDLQGRIPGLVQSGHVLGQDQEAKAVDHIVQIEAKGQAKPIFGLNLMLFHENILSI